MLDELQNKGQNLTCNLYKEAEGRNLKQGMTEYEEIYGNGKIQQEKEKRRNDDNVGDK
jgi:hypothetical protein